MTNRHAFCRRWPILAAAALLVVPGPPARADLVLSDNLSAPSGGTEGAAGDTWLTAGFGTDGSSYDLTSVTLLLQRDSIVADAELAIYDDGGLQPGSLLGTLDAPGSLPSGLSDVTFTTSGIALAADSSYWVVLRAVTGSLGWAWASDPSGTGPGFQHTWGSTDDAGGLWFTFDSYPTQMRVTAAAVPEPASVALVAIGGSALFAVRRPHRHRARVGRRDPS